VRPLQDDGSSDATSISRDYSFEFDESPAGAPLLSIIGGKITTYRRLAEAALDHIATHLPARHGQSAGWTGTKPLPGGDFEIDGLGRLAAGLMRDYPFIEREEAARLTRSYGTRAWSMLGDAKVKGDLGRSFGPALTEREVNYLINAEWARTAEDVLWRRSKVGLRLPRDAVQSLGDQMARLAPAHPGVSSPA
jgi:glycerol-3-phosphate dehydrogenase